LDFLPQNAEIAIILDVALAMLLGAIIGLERELENKPAGLRTHMLVAGAAALFVALGDVVVRHYSQQLSSQLVQTDAVRIIEAVITGVSFLGAGTIFHRERESYVEGLTTAASLLFTTAVGVSIALSQFILAVGATVLVLITLHLLGLLEAHFERRRQEEPRD
jgi:putative Mg2+ transporter-C (MgtC) family protein